MGETAHVGRVPSLDRRDAADVGEFREVALCREPAGETVGAVGTAHREHGSAGIVEALVVADYEKV